MRVISIYVSSVDGKVTKWGSEPSEWASREDQRHYAKEVRRHSLILMGSGSFAGSIRLRPGVLRVVMTADRKRYVGHEVPGQLEFTEEAPEVIVRRLEALGYREMLLVGGPGTTTAFLEAGLVDELWLTVEPRIFGKGQYMVESRQLDISLQLREVERLNHHGALLLKYDIRRVADEGAPLPSIFTRE